MNASANLADTVASARKTAMLVAAADLGTLVATGKDRLSWLNGLVTCELVGLTPGHAVYGLTVAKKGRIVCDLVIVNAGDSLVLVVPSRVRDELFTAFEHYLVMEDVELTKGDGAVFFVHGPRAREVRIDGAVCAEIDVTGLGGAVVICSQSFHEKIAKITENLGGCIGDDAAWEALRVEQGVPRFGRDFDDSTYPQEASLEKRAVSFDKGCYLGQEVVCMLELRGQVKRKLVPVTLSAPAPTGTPVTDAEGKEIGQLTSVAFGPTTNQHLGLAMIKRAHTAPGSVLRAGDATLHVR